jgi:hypothetical protein
MASKKSLYGLTRKLLMGRTAEIRAEVERGLRSCGVPDALAAGSARRLSKPGVILSLTGRRLLGGRRKVEKRVRRILRDQQTVASLQACLNATEERVRALEAAAHERDRALQAAEERARALEAAKVEDEKALLEAQLAMARLRASLAAPSA